MEKWNAFARGFTFQSAPWLFAETYVYRLIMDACSYFEKRIDPFRPQKLQALVEAKQSIRKLGQLLKTITANKRLVTAEELTEMLYMNLWSNAGDLSRHPDGGHGTSILGSSSKMPEKVLINDTAETQKLFESFELCDEDKSNETVIILTDNCGIEIIKDMWLGEMLLASKLATKIEFHVKFHPTFVSDVIEDDINDTLFYISNIEPELGKILQKRIDTHHFEIFNHPYYNSFEGMWVMPLELYIRYSNARFVISKGDANARRFHGDRAWEFTTPTEEVISYFPSPLIIIRTFKSETVTGITESIIKEFAHNMISNWYHSGEYGEIQLIYPPNSKYSIQRKKAYQIHKQHIRNSEEICLASKTSNKRTAPNFSELIQPASSGSGCTRHELHFSKYFETPISH